MRKLLVVLTMLAVVAGCAKNVHWFRVTDDCMTDACITEMTGDIDPANPLPLGERNEK